ncbi:MAG: alpha/beta fold hydrolase, partial [Cyanobacteria bacterium P01_H01_bin.130]
MATIHVRTIPHHYDLSAPRPGRCPIIFIHGWLLSRHYWQPMVDLLSEDYQCLAYDLRGFGDSQPGAAGGGNPAIALNPLNHQPGDQSSQRRRFESYTPRAYAEDIGELMDRLGIEKAWLVGHSLGGTVALWGSHHLGDRIAGVVCLNAGGGIYLENEFRTFRTVGQRLVKWRPRWLKHLPLLHWALCYDSVPHPLPVRWGRQRVLDFMGADRDAALGS